MEISDDLSKPYASKRAKSKPTDGDLEQIETGTYDDNGMPEKRRRKGEELKQNVDVALRKNLSHENPTYEGK